VADLKGHCPNIAFDLGNYEVTASSSTSFSGGKCGDVRNGAQASASGTLTADRTIAASAISIERK